MTLADKAKQIVSKHGDIETAYEALLRAVMRDKELQRECIEPAVRHAIHQARCTATKTAKRPGLSMMNSTSIAVGMRTATVAFLDNYFIAGKRLGDVTRSELMSEAMEERSQARARLQNANYYELLASMTPEGKTVRESIGEEKAWRLYQKETKQKSRGLRRGVTHATNATA